MLKYFGKVENRHDKGASKKEHGFAGPIHTTSISLSSPSLNYPLERPLKAAWSSIGVQEAQDGDALGYTEATESWRNGKRQLASQAYPLAGIEVLPETLAQNIIIEPRNGKKVATGVQLTNGTTIAASKEVILSAGVFRSPQILKLSRIGPTSELSQRDIETVLDVLGQSFHNHLVTALCWNLKHPSRGLAFGTPAWSDSAYTFGLPLNAPVFQTFYSSPTLPAALLADGETLETNAQLDPSSHTETDRAITRAAVRSCISLFRETADGQAIVECEVLPDGQLESTSESTDNEIDERVERVGVRFGMLAGQ
ncbi:GMC oxidoreductase [Amniculicola lignicola CBS 123094]|uniref:GMC oxidoreductase n=1 Tax=Amniculicola lignicola CBS 123094 TaxID=1392246 RepID=A0A6A5W0Q6_9PLEO|nr:GMC oxidoreductase [Amniculicola lignicola CBS 123094]